MIIKNKLVEVPIISIIKQIKIESNKDIFRDIKDKGKEVMCTCPYHSEGKEKHPSFSIHSLYDDHYGVFHCFTCNTNGNIITLISDCLELNKEDSEDWLTERFSNGFIEKEEILPEIQLYKTKKNKVLDESILDEYRYFHPYMFQRKLTEEVIRKFQIGCTPDGKYITFPCWDEKGNLVGIFKRSTTTKEFIIPTDIEKPVYLLNYIIKEGHTKVVVCESQINALTAWTFGYPAIALFGTGNSTQYNILKKSGIRNYILAFDGDEAGDKGRDRFIKNMGNDFMITTKLIPRGKDLNDLTKEEFDSLKTI